MREILFKAKVKEEPNDWVEGYLSKCERKFIISNDDGVGVFINPETICQYTGLTDKNDNKIWENDILLQKTTGKHWCQWECMGVVKYGEHDWNVSEYGFTSIGFYIEPIVRNGNINKIACGLNQVDINDEFYPIEVIGNIFDNPELKEGAE